MAEISTSGEVELYNAAGLRHELVSFLQRELAPEQYGIQVEREVKAVVLKADVHFSPVAVLDIYIFERAGKGQYCIQVLTPSNPHHLNWAEASKQIRFLEHLSVHGFEECALFLAYQQPSLHAESELNFLKAEPAYPVEWKELLPATQDSNGPWRYCFLQINEGARQMNPETGPLETVETRTLETIKLTHLNSAFRVKGNNKRRSLELKSIFFPEALNPNITALELQILDEKDLTIFSQNLLPAYQQGQIVLEINRRFDFYDHLTVSIMAEPSGAALAAEVSFE